MHASDFCKYFQKKMYSNDNKDKRQLHGATLHKNGPLSLFYFNFVN